MNFFFLLLFVGSLVSAFEYIKITTYYSSKNCDGTASEVKYVEPGKCMMYGLLIPSYRVTYDYDEKSNNVTEMAYADENCEYGWPSGNNRVDTCLLFGTSTWMKFELVDEVDETLKFLCTYYDEDCTEQVAYDYTLLKMWKLLDCDDLECGTKAKCGDEDRFVSLMTCKNTDDDKGSTSSGLSTGAVVGIVLGSVCCVLISFLFLFLVIAFLVAVAIGFCVIVCGGVGASFVGFSRFKKGEMSIQESGKPVKNERSKYETLDDGEEDEALHI